jgi:hypothetical protein
MFLFDSSSSHSDDSAASFIGENLPICQGTWLRSRCDCLGQTRAEISTAVVKGWLLSHPDKDLMKLEEGELARRAMSESIMFHHKEFLPVVFPS